MNLRDLEYLVALDEHRHFGRAAAASYASQPTLSTQLRKLEAELGAPLIERGSRQVLFTAAGDEVVRRARRILGEVDDIRGIARASKDPLAGSLRLGIFPTLGPYLLPHLIPALGERYEDLELLLVEEKTQPLLDQLRAGSVDAAILALPLTDETLRVEPLFREEFLLAAPAKHPLAKGVGRVRSAELTGTDLLLLGEGHCLRDQALDVCRLAGAAERQGFQATSLETLRHMVAAGCGVTLLPELAVSPPVPATTGIVLRRFADPVPHRDVAMVWRRTSVRSALLEEIADLIRELPAVTITPLSA